MDGSGVAVVGRLVKGSLEGKLEGFAEEPETTTVGKDDGGDVGDTIGGAERTTVGSYVGMIVGANMGDVSTGRVGDEVLAERSLVGLTLEGYKEGSSVNVGEGVGPTVGDREDVGEREV